MRIIKRRILVSAAILTYVILSTGFTGCLLPEEFGIYKVGNRWEYEIETETSIVHTNEGIPDSFDTTKTSSLTEAVDKTHLTSGEKIMVAVVRMTNGDSVSVFYVKSERDYFYYYIDLDAAEECYKIPSDPVLGDRWDVTTITVIDDTIYDTCTVSCEVVADGEPANGFDYCLKIEMKPDNVADYDTYESFQYWVHDVGIVMTTSETVQVEIFEDDTLTTTVKSETNLKSFTEG